ncbi:hypothetical protein [Terracidiphilus gabretensis]|uniref:hypothetical protein n=1 Tax=Terracidiphilus gabretensis TaxID=1577687 RepID=UPI00071C1197|nr:hypothetical protein [Terracidiphilus gabretensis]
MKSMIRFCAIHLLCLALCMTAIAQQSVTQNNPEPPTLADTVTISREIKIEFFLLESVSSSTAERGQIVRLAVANDVSTNGVVVIPKGTLAEGKVTHVHQGIPGKRDGQITVEATSMLLSNGQRLRLRQYPPGEDDCGDMGPCVVLAIVVAPVAIIALAVYAVISPVALADYIRNRKYSPKVYPAGTQMTLQPCERVDAYLSKKIAIQPSGLTPASASLASGPFACETMK